MLESAFKVFAGSKQKELEVGSMALMAGYTPIATLLLTILVPIFEPVGFFERNEETLFGFQYTPQVSSPDVTLLLLHSSKDCAMRGHTCRDLPTIRNLKSRYVLGAEQLQKRAELETVWESAQ